MTKLALAVLAALIMASSASEGARAQDSDARYAAPSYFRVGALPPGETLTVRGGPAGDTEALGELVEDAGPIEVVSVTLNGRTEWAEIIFQERNAFVARRFLEPLAIDTLPGSAIPQLLSCHGTEPFWSVGFPGPNDAVLEVLSSQDGQPMFFRVADIRSAQNRGGAPAVISLEGAAANATLFVDRGWCSDGMSDRDYGWRAFLILDDATQSVFQGCCFVQPVD